MKFRALFSIALRHAYYPVGPGPLSLSPCPETEAVLDGHRGLCKQVPRGIDLVQAMNGGGEPLVPFDPSSSLRFVLGGDPAGLERITNFHALRNRKGAPVYVNKRRGLALEHRKLEKLPPGAIAYVEITALPGLLRRRSAPTWTLELGARKGHWRYYLVLDPGSGPASSYTLRAEPAQALTFEVDEVAAKPKDEVAVNLRRRFPTKRILRFRSTTEVESSAAPGFSLTLELDNEPVLDELPCPSVDDMCLPLERGDALALYHVVRFDKRSAKIRGAA